MAHSKLSLPQLRKGIRLRQPSVYTYQAKVFVNVKSIIPGSNWLHLSEETLCLSDVSQVSVFGPLLICKPLAVCLRMYACLNAWNLPPLSSPFFAADTDHRIPQVTDVQGLGFPLYTTFTTPAHCREAANTARRFLSMVRRPIQQVCEDTGCSPEDLPEMMNDREKWRERVRDIRACGTTWWWWWWYLWIKSTQYI